MPEAVALLAQFDLLREALRKYGTHRPGCMSTLGEQWYCTCGLNAVISDADKQATQKHHGASNA